MTKIGLLLLWGMLLITKHVHAQSISSLTLSDVLAAAMSVQQTKLNEAEKTGDSLVSSAWLASSPSLSVNYLKSDLSQGTDESELSINLPIKSFFQRDIDKRLVQTSKLIPSLFLSQQKLYLSGLIRDQIWAIKIAEAKQENLKQTLAFLSNLEQQYQRLFDISASSRYPLLLIKKEKLNIEIELLSQTESINNLHSQYQLITGLKQLPTQLNEEFVAEQSMQLMSQHPAIKALEQQWFETEQRLKLSGNKSQPWNVSLSAKNLTNNQYKETQLGVGVEVPLTIFSIDSQVLSNEWLIAKHSYDLARSSQLITLQQNYQSLISRHQMLIKKQSFLEQSKNLSKAIIKETQLLIDANEIEQGQAIRRMLSAFNSKIQFNLNKLHLQQSTAMLKQAAGISL